MSSSPGRREVAHRVFAAEFDDADFSYSESDEERAPNYVVMPSGARVNRLFLVGVLTAVERVNEEMLRARVVDPTGAFVVYAGQYQPDELAFLERIEPPAYLAVTGKARTFEPEDGDRVFTSVRPESINEVDEATRDRWAVHAAERTLHRVGTMAAAVESGLSGEALRAALATAGVDESLAAGIPLALDHYGTTPDYLAALRELSLDVARLIADEIDEVEPFDAAPEEGDGDASRLADPDLALAAPESTPSTEEPADPAEEPDLESGEEAEPESDTADVGTEPEPQPVADSAGTGEPTGAESTTAEEAEPGTTADTGRDDIGDFEPGEFDTGEEAEEPPEDVLDEEERREVEEEYGTDFSTASEVDEPDEAGVESVSEPEPDAEAAGDAEAEPGVQQESEIEEPGESEAEEPGESEAEEQEPTAGEPVEERAAAESGAAEQEDAPAEEPAEDVSVEDAVMDAMVDLDDGDGADREAVVERAAERAGATVDEVEEAIQDLLMSGQCYEPDDSRLKPI